MIRNHLGHLIAASSHCYGICSSVVAEFRALYDGILLFKSISEISTCPIVLETDSKVMVDVLTSKAKAPLLVEAERKVGKQSVFSVSQCCKSYGPNRVKSRYSRKPVGNGEGRPDRA